MGRIFSAKEIEKRKIPELKCFPLVTNHMRAALEGQSGIVGAILCGSALTPDCTIRSDINCVVVYEEGREQQVFLALQEIISFGSRFHIPVELIPVSMEAAKAGIHPINLDFGYHLMHRSRKEELIIKENPVRLFNIGGRDKMTDARHYIHRKLGKLEEGFVRMPTMGSKEFHRFLQKAVEAPVRVIRKMIMTVISPHDIPFTTNGLIQRYSISVGQREQELLLRIREPDSRYTGELTKRFESKDKLAYPFWEHWIDKFQRLVPDVIEFTRLNALRLG